MNIYNGIGELYVSADDAVGSSKYSYLAGRLQWCT